ncbi:MAG: serine hydrolase [Myxococcota bacterium]|nr:serine hydrolase [Myxococcota bacterium]
MGRFDEILQRGIERGAAPGASATVVSRDAVLWEGGAGERRLGSGLPMRVDTVGAIHSMTKALTGAAAMQMVERGQLILDEPAYDVIPWLGEVEVLEGFEPDGSPRTRKPRSLPTLRQLLTHTSGFVYEIWNENDVRWRGATGTPSLFSVTHASLKVPLAFDPGTRWEYGIGIDWVGQMIEVISGLSLGAYLAENLTGPLGMTDTAFVLSQEMQQRAAGVHTRELDGTFQFVEVSSAGDPEYEMGGGGLQSTMPDYGRFIRMILNDGELDGVRVLKPETVEEMAKNQIGSLRVSALKTVAPEYSNDAEFFSGEPKSWGLTFQIGETACETGRPKGTLMWAGLANSFFWIDRLNGLGGAYLSKILPFADEGSMDLFFEIEREAYNLWSVPHS